MSGRSVTITIGSTGSIRTTPVAATNGAKLAGEKSKDKMYEPKHSKKMVRVLTVIAYMFTVSLAAIMLSIYYVFLWSPRYANRLVLVNTPSPPSPSLTIITTAETTTSMTTTIPTSSEELLVPCSCPSLSNVPSAGERSHSSENLEANQLVGSGASTGVPSGKHPFVLQTDINNNRIVISGPDTS